MPELQTKSKPEVNFLEANFEHHVIAAKYCNQAAMEHSQAARCCATGINDKAEGHAKNALHYCTIAQDHSKRAMRQKSDG
jgi:hypothetical protein